VLLHLKALGAHHPLMPDKLPTALCGAHKSRGRGTWPSSPWPARKTSLTINKHEINRQLFTVRAAAYQLRQDTHQDMRKKRQKLTSASWLRPVCGSFHNLIRFNCSPFFASCRRHRVLTVTCLDACRCAAYLRRYLDWLEVNVLYCMNKQ
jgi:hypothetical protein